VQSTVDINQPIAKSKAWSSVQVLTMATICLCLGILVGYLASGSQKSLQKAQSDESQPPAGHAAGAPAMPTMDQMKHMADKSAEPLLEKLKASPNDPGLLSQVAKVYFSTHQFPEAISYAERAIQADPKQVGNRADLASYYFYSGNADKAIVTLEDALKVQPNNPQVLFNLGILKLQAKDDRPGAIALWKQLLKTNPNLPEERRQAVQRAIMDASKKPAAAAQR
jgi:cytochrome c-type biogenesis protein CcmH/NrfG